MWGVVQKIRAMLSPRNRQGLRDLEGREGAVENLRPMSTESLGSDHL